MDNIYRGEQLVYGDFSLLLNLEVHGDIGEIGVISWNLINLERCLFFGFISYVFSKAGYYDVTMFDDSRYHFNSEEGIHEYAEKGDLTTNYDEDQWVSVITRGLTGWTEELRAVRDEEGSAIIDDLKKFLWWSHRFEHLESKELLNLIFLHHWLYKKIVIPDEETDDGKPWLNVPLYPYKQNYIIIKPSEYGKAKQTPEQLQELRDILSQQNQPASLVSVDGFVAEVIPDPEKKHIIFENWIMIREKVLKSFLKEYPVLVFALEQKRISQAEILLKQSRREFEDGKFDHVVTDSAKACEALLNVLYHKNYGEAPFHLEFGDFLYRMKELIETELGSLVYTDLDFIRYWRNLVVHPQEYEITLDKKTAFQVIARSEMFYELFKNVLNPFKKEP